MSYSSFDENEFLKNVNKHNYYSRKHELLRLRTNLLKEIHLNQELLCRIDETLIKLNKIYL